MIRRLAKQAKEIRRKQHLFSLGLAINSPLIDGKESRVISRLINYDIETAKQIMAGEIVDFEPRNTFFPRLKAKLKS